jgi:hypothetical protein
MTLIVNRRPRSRARIGRDAYADLRRAAALERYHALADAGKIARRGYDRSTGALQQVYVDRLGEIAERRESAERWRKVWTARYWDGRP